MVMQKVCLMWVLVVLIVAGGEGIGVKGQGSGDAEAPEAAVQQADCSGTMEELSVCNASMGATTPASECCDALRSLGPQCMCNVFLGPPIPGLSRDQAFLLPRNCNLPRIRCTTPPSPSDSAAASAPVGTSSSADTSVFFLGVDDDDDDEQQHISGAWLGQKQGGF